MGGTLAPPALPPGQAEAAKCVDPRSPWSGAARPRAERSVAGASASRVSVGPDELISATADAPAESGAQDSPEPSPLDEARVAIRAGHHCAQPLMEALGVPATARASFGVYNGPGDIDRLVAGIERVARIFG